MLLVAFSKWNTDWEGLVTEDLRNFLLGDKSLGQSAGIIYVLCPLTTWKTWIFRLICVSNRQQESHSQCAHTLTTSVDVLYDKENVCVLHGSYVGGKSLCCVCNNLERGLNLPEQSVGVLEVGWCSANGNEAKRWKMIQLLVYSSEHVVLKKHAADKLLLVTFTQSAAWFHEKFVFILWMLVAGIATCMW